MSSDPFVSVIVPVYNGRDGIAKTVTALQVQDYPHDRYEIIIVDNGSTDGTQELIKTFPVMFLSEPVKSSYAARNAGIRIARGEVLAFTDADCTPDPSWISSGVHFLKTKQVSVAGGKVTFTYSPHPTAAEYADALINIDNDDSIRRHGMAATANLFSLKSVFDQVGLFDPTLQSGGDGQWTARVARAGIQVGYTADAQVSHPARTFPDLIRKHVRIGSGSVAVWKARGKGIPWRIAAFLYLLTPLYALRIPGMIRRRGYTWLHPVFRIMLIAQLCKLATAWGIAVHAWHRIGRLRSH